MSSYLSTNKSLTIICSTFDWLVQETAILEKEGSVLLLGRSGTGKTVCLLNRILRDRHRFGSSLRQLFVARTKVCLLTLLSYDDR